MGKKMAMGGNITDITQAKVRYIPSTNSPWIQGALPRQSKYLSDDPQSKKPGRKNFRRVVSADNGNPENDAEQQNHNGDTGRF